MSEAVQRQTVRGLLDKDNVKARFQEVLRDNAAGFTANLAIMVNNSAALSKCDPMSIVSAAVVSASLNLPLDPNLGFAALVPYGDKVQFQIMYKGILQLAQRSGQYKTIGVTEVYEGELKEGNRLTGEYTFDFNAKTSDKIIGYAAYFKLINGFEKTEFWDVTKVEKHGKKYSQTYKKGYGKWTEDFDAMGKKTVLKNLISKWGILSIEMQKAVVTDQAIVKGITEDAEIEYVDNMDQSQTSITHEASNPLEVKVEKIPKAPEKKETPKPEEGKLL